MAKYYSGETSEASPFVASPEFTLYCCKCQQVINHGDMVVDREVWKCGELDYIETSHAACNEPTADDAARITAQRIREDQAARAMQAETDAFLDALFSSPAWKQQEADEQTRMMADLEEQDEEPVRFIQDYPNVDTRESGWDL